jgi:hypothetical protein
MAVDGLDSPLLPRAVVVKIHVAEGIFHLNA